MIFDSMATATASRRFGRVTLLLFDGMSNVYGHGALLNPGSDGTWDRPIAANPNPKAIREES